MKLRDYQSLCLARIDEALAAHRSALAVMATGLGKTVCFAALARDWPGRVLILAHREELISQAVDKLKAVGVRAGVEMGQDSVARLERHAELRDKVVVSSVQTMCRPGRRERFAPDAFGLVVVDEAHHAVARTYRDVLDYFAAARVLGVTATPKRADQLAMGQVFEACCFDYGIEPAVDDGWLVPVRQQLVKVEGLDFSQVRKTAGDFNEADLERILTEEKHLHAVAAPAVELAGDRPALVFCVTVAHAEMLAAVINRYKPGAATALSGTTPKEDRRRVVADFKAGRLQILCNCALFLEGFDAPATAVVVMARPTQSLSLYVQVLGRGTRVLKDVIESYDASGDLLWRVESPAERRAAIARSAKPFMTALDFVGNSGRHKIVTAADVLGGKWGEPVRHYARKTLEDEGRPAPLAEALERADAEMRLSAEQEEWRRRERIRAREVSYRAEEVNPFAGGGAAGGVAPGQEMATKKQVGYILYLSRDCGGGWTWDKAARLTKSQAQGVIGKLQKGQVA